MRTNEEIKAIVATAFKPLRCVAEIWDYDPRGVARAETHDATVTQASLQARVPDYSGPREDCTATTEIFSGVESSRGR